MLKALLLQQSHETGRIKDVFGLQEQARLASLCGMTPAVLSMDEIDVHLESARQTELLFSTWGMPALTDAEIAHYFPALKSVFYAAGSVQYFARPFLERGIKVFSAWVANGVPVAEYTLAQILLANKGFFSRLTGTRKRSFTPGNVFPGNYEATVGIIGTGCIGSMVIKMLAPYHLKVLAYDAFLSPEKQAELGCEFCGLERIFSECDVISNHLADNAQTRGMLDKSLFDRMKPLATFINTGRGRQVVEADLAAALTEQPGRTALLDVVAEEPIQPDNIFYNMENVFLSPHIAGSLGNELHRMAAYMVDECERYLNGQQLLYEITLPMLDTMA